MSILIPGMEIPRGRCEAVIFVHKDGSAYIAVSPEVGEVGYFREYPLVSVPPHGRLIDADALRQSMYHEAFETDSPMQKWDSGCWIRYKMFERLEESAPTIIPADKEDE